MKRFILPLFFGLVCFVGFLIAAMPARAIFDLAIRPAGVQAGQVQGRVWDAQLLRIRAGDLSVAEARAELAPGSLLSLSPRFEFTLADPDLRGQGVATLRAGGVVIEDASGVVRLDQVAPQIAFVAPDAVLQITLETLSVDREGRCQQASGRALTPALAELGERYGVALPTLQFDIVCAGDAVGADLSGQSDAVAFSGRLSFGNEGPEGRIQARSTERDVIAALSFAGFEQIDPSTYELTLPLPEEG